MIVSGMITEMTGLQKICPGVEWHSLAKKFGGNSHFGSGKEVIFGLSRPGNGKMGGCTDDDQAYRSPYTKTINRLIYPDTLFCSSIMEGK